VFHIGALFLCGETTNSQNVKYTLPCFDIHLHVSIAFVTTIIMVQYKNTEKI